MPPPTTSEFWNQTTPAAPTGDQNNVIQSDGATPQQMLTAYPKRMVGDTGSGGKAGTVPPPAAGDAAAGKFLKADGTFAVPPSTSPLTTKGDLFGHSTVDARIPVGADGQSIVADSTQTLGVRWSDRVSTVGITIDGGGSPPTAGLKGIIQIPFAGTIIGWSAVGDVSGSASLDVWKVASSAPPSAPVIPTSGNKISASAPVALSSAQSAAVGTSGVSTWTTAVAAWDTFGFNLASASTLTRVTIVLHIKRS